MEILIIGRWHLIVTSPKVLKMGVLRKVSTMHLIFYTASICDLGNVM